MCYQPLEAVYAPEREADVSLGITTLELSGFCVHRRNNTKMMNVLKFSSKSEGLVAVKLLLRPK